MIRTPKSKSKSKSKHVIGKGFHEIPYVSPIHRTYYKKARKPTSQQVGKRASNEKSTLKTPKIRHVSRRSSSSWKNIYHLISSCVWTKWKINYKYYKQWAPLSPNSWLYVCMAVYHNPFEPANIANAGWTRWMIRSGDHRVCIVWSARPPCFLINLSTHFYVLLFLNPLSVPRPPNLPSMRAGHLLKPPNRNSNRSFRFVLASCWHGLRPHS